jgi:hypothetical protein
VTIQSRYGSTTYADTVGLLLEDHERKIINLDEFKLVSDVHLPDEPDPERPDVDWKTFWAKTVAEHDWLIDPVIPRGRSIALYAPAGEGKSELVLALACQAALKGISVLYLDFEMTTADLMDRLYDMEYGPDTDLSNLHYQLHPTIPTLDTADGGQALAEAAAERDAQLIIIDTFMRIVAGKENDSDTLLNYDLHTGRLLKTAGRAVLRVDHAGKDVTLGARGTSAKRDDVDLIWRLQRRDKGVRLQAEKRRMGWIPEYVDLNRNDFPVTYTPALATWPDGTERLAKILDELEVDPDLGRPAVRQILKDSGETARNETLSAAIKYRRETTHQLRLVKPLGQRSGQDSETPGQRMGQSGVSMNDTPPFEGPSERASEGPLEEDWDPDFDDLPEPFDA